MTAPMPGVRRIRPVDLYYLAGTPAFALLDHFGGISVRAAFLDGWPAARYGYYGVCFACGVAAWRLPARARWIAMTESGANIVLLIFSVMMAYYGAVDRVAADLPVGDLFGAQRAVNLAISGAALMIPYFRSRTPALSD